MNKKSINQKGLYILLLLVFLGCTKKNTTVQMPTLTTKSLYSVTAEIAISGGIISNEGGTAITACGVCWDTSSGPSITKGQKTNDSSVSGSFKSIISGLKTNTKYYARAYATNAVGTAYGNELVFTTTAVQVGSMYQGGIVVYVYQVSVPGSNNFVLHGLIAAPNDQSVGIAWGNAGFEAGGTNDDSVGGGWLNTNNIIAQDSGTNAATVCRKLSLGGFSDWSLPNTQEWYYICENKALIGAVPSHNYWSSSYYNDGMYAGPFFGSFSNTYCLGTAVGSNYDLYCVRAVRYF